MKSYFKFLSRNKLYTAIEAVGLVVSLAFLLIIGSSIRDQRAIVKGVSDHENLYLVGPPGRQLMVQYRLTGELSSLPQVKRTGVLSIISMPLSIHGMRYSVKVAVMDETMLEMIPLKGSDGRNITFSGTEDVLITESAARRIFPARIRWGRRLDIRARPTAGRLKRRFAGLSAVWTIPPTPISIFWSTWIHSLIPLHDKSGKRIIIKTACTHLY